MGNLLIATSPRLVQQHFDNSCQITDQRDNSENINAQLAVDHVTYQISSDFSRPILWSALIGRSLVGFLKWMVKYILYEKVMYKD